MSLAATQASATAGEERGRALLRFAWAVARFVLTIAVTLLGLLAVTFIIGRVVPIDPVLAIVGDRAPQRVYLRVREELGLDLPLIQQFWIYCTKVLTGDFGRSVLTTNPVLVRHRPLFPGDHRACDLRHAGRHPARRAARRVRRGALGKHPGPDRPRRRPDRLFRADLLARADGAPALLRQARLGGGAGPARHLLRLHRDAGHRHAHRRQPDAGRVRRSSATSSPTSSFRARCSAISRSPTSAA